MAQSRTVASTRHNSNKSRHRGKVQIDNDDNLTAWNSVSVNMSKFAAAEDLKDGEKTAGKSKSTIKPKNTNEYKLTSDALALSPPNEWDLTEMVEDEKRKAIEENHRDWPWRRELVPDRVLTQAPFALNQYNFDAVFSEKKVEQACLLFCLGHDLKRKLVNNLFSHGHLAAANFAATCQQAFREVDFWISHWDVSRGDFCDCEKVPRNEYARLDEVVVVSPFRTRLRVIDTFAGQFVNLHKMTIALRNFSENFVTLHLHRIPFLTPDVLALVVPYMRRLEFLGVYSCELFHLGHTKRLLDIISADRGNWMTKNIQLDFYPRFHVGPDPDIAGHHYTGSYGATWDNFDGLDTRLAIWAVVSKAMYAAKKQGMDLVSKGKALRLWLDKSPCWMVEETIKALQLPVKPENTNLVATMINYPHTKGSEKVYQKRDNQWNLETHACEGCKNLRLGVFFDYEEFATSMHTGPTSTVQRICLGCKLEDRLDSEIDHNKQAKKAVTKKWLTARRGYEDTGNLIKDDLNRALLGCQQRPALKMAGRIDQAFALHLSSNRQLAGVDYDLQAGKANVKYSPCIFRDKKDRKPSRW